MKKITLLIIVSAFTITSFAQISISGVVSNDSIPLESASVVVKNSTNGIATNKKGEFKLKVKDGDTIAISYLGYETKEIVALDKMELDVKLKEGGLLDEIVINAFDYNGCRLSCTCGICILYKEELIISDPKLFPNPSSNGVFNLKLYDDYDEVKISVSNMSGQTIQNSNYKAFGNQKQLDLSQFSTGIYIINIFADGKRLDAIKAIIN